MRVLIVILKPLIHRRKWKRAISSKRKRVLNSDSKPLERKSPLASINVFAKVFNNAEVKRETNYKGNKRSSFKTVRLR